MILDFQQVTTIEGVVAFPDWAFAALPKPDSDMHETVILIGASSSSVNITGSVDSPE